jgi:DNA modification methylase
VQPWHAYWKMAFASLEEMYRVLEPSGRLWLNTLVVVPELPVRRDRAKNRMTGENRVDLLSGWASMAEDVGFKYRDTIAWVQDSHDAQCAWGSWLRPSAPNIRGSWESVLVLYKGSWKRRAPDRFRAWNAPRMDGDTDWTDIVRNVWKIPPRQNRGYPATFPDELVRRCIRLSTWPNEVVLDPYSGSGTTERVAQEMNRLGIGCDIHA